VGLPALQLVFDPLGHCGAIHQSLAHLPWLRLSPIKDLVQFALRALAFLGSRVEWRGQRYRVDSSGKIDRKLLF
jgi:hypothetical protein